ncbi:MAG TPA: FKBP-type peptidyl-prolyl cis-trans isomerase [Acidobacteriaceae bacterium]|nr:FKBP-type peptidyl-prolyl cis-trans isomerase [Acidobacteriaceae bacterium]
MLRYFSASAILLTSGMMLMGELHAQQAPTANAQQSASTKTKTSSAAATHRTPAAKSHSALALTTQKDKASYAIGMSIGMNLHRQSLDVDPAIVARGLKDALGGTKPLLTDDEAKAVLTELQMQMRQQEQQKLLAAADVNKKEGDAFLAANRAKEGVVVLPSGLQYKILQQGTGPKPTINDVVVCNYRGTLINGKEFDSSAKHGQPATFPVGRVIKGWTEALQLMPTGSKWEIYLPADLAYGGRGAGPDIGPEATLIFDVDLLEIKHPDAAPAQPGEARPIAPPQTFQPTPQTQPTPQSEGQPAAQPNRTNPPQPTTRPSSNP